MVPINVTSSHWFLVHLSLTEKSLTVYDSLQARSLDNYHNVLSPLQPVLDAYFGIESKAALGVTEQQTNGYDCGVAVCINARRIVTSATVGDLKHSEFQRKRIAIELATQKLI